MAEAGRDGTAAATRLVHAPGWPDPASGALVPPLVMSATFAHGNPAQLAYGRERNPTWEILEAVVADLEGAPGAVAFASGMAAIDAVLSLLRLQSRVAVADDAYSGTRQLLDHLEGEGRLRQRPVRATDVDPAAAADSDLVWLETLGNPLLTVPDLPLWAAAARDAGALLVVDNTLATPLLCRPLELGADLVVHSASKHMGGHSDLMLGVVAASDPGHLERLRRHRNRHGSCPGQMEAWLTLRGLRTLDVRLRRQCETAAWLAAELRGWRGIERVHYPGLPDHPQHQLASRRLQGGYGAMLSIVVAADAAAVERACASTRIWTNATSLGSVESLLERRGRWAGEEYLPAGLVRLSVGLEDRGDLLQDLAGALAVAGAGPQAG